MIWTHKYISQLSRNRFFCSLIVCHQSPSWASSIRFLFLSFSIYLSVFLSLAHSFTVPLCHIMWHLLGRRVNDNFVFRMLFCSVPIPHNFTYITLPSNFISFHSETATSISSQCAVCVARTHARARERTYSETRDRLYSAKINWPTSNLKFITRNIYSDVVNGFSLYSCCCCGPSSPSILFARVPFALNFDGPLFIRRIFNLAYELNCDSFFTSLFKQNNNNINSIYMRGDD